jgi:hypothetical protein
MYYRVVGRSAKGEHNQGEQRFGWSGDYKVIIELLLEIPWIVLVIR